MTMTDRAAAARHLTRYDDALEATAGRVGRDTAVRAIRRRIFDAIAEAYPEYDAECRYQRDNP